MAKIAKIWSGYEEGSEKVIVRCYDRDGLIIELYQHDTLLGSNTLKNSETTIRVSPLQRSEYDLYVLVKDPLEFVDSSRNNGTQPVVESDTILTGWKTPSSISLNGITKTAEEYEILVESNPDQYRSLSQEYDPTLALNKTPDKESLLAFASQKISFDMQIIQNEGQTVVTITAVRGNKGGYTVQFDDGAIGSGLSKIYTVAGIYKVKLVDLGDSNNVIEKSYSVTINPVPSATTTINNLGIRQQYGDYQGIGFVFANHPQQLEFSIDGVNGGVWYAGEGGSNEEWYRIIPNIPTGTQTMRARVMSNPSDIMTRTFKQL